MFLGCCAEMVNSGQHFFSEEAQRFQRFLLRQTRTAECEIDHANAGLFMKLGDLLHHGVRTAIEV